MRIFSLICGLILSCHVFALDLEWDLPTDLTGIAGYEVHYGSSSGGYSEIVDVPGEASTTASVPDPTGTTYYSVRSRNANSTEFSSLSNEVIAGFTAPLDPIGFSVEVTPTPQDLVYVNLTTLSFDESSIGVEIGPLNVFTNAISILANVNRNTSSNVDGRIVSKAIGSGSDDHFWMLSNLNGSLRARIKTGGITKTLVGGNLPIDSSGWTHVAMTYDGATLKIYIDGIEVGSLAVTGEIDSDPVPAMIGNNYNPYSSWSGDIKDVKIYNYALSPSEISTEAGN